MTTEVIILSQGRQTRMGMAHGYKQLLSLPACGGTAIIVRTLMQLSVLDTVSPMWVNIVGWEDLLELISWRLEAPVAYAELRNTPGMINMVTLAEPGNSSLRGIARYLDLYSSRRGDRTVVLFGDTVYSWACLRSMFLAPAYAFVGTKNLRYDLGELWGVCWAHDCHDAMMSRLRDSLLRHPPFDDDYMPGQMRRWVSGFHRGHMVDHINSMRRMGNYIDIDDYTMDIDTTSQIAMLPELSRKAAEDDLVAGLRWKP